MMIAVDHVSYGENKYMEIHGITYPEAEEIILKATDPGMNPDLEGTFWTITSNYVGTFNSNQIFIIDEISHLMLGAPFSKYIKTINKGHVNVGTFKLELKTVIVLEEVTENINRLKNEYMI